MTVTTNRNRTRHPAGALVPLLAEARMTPENSGYKFARLARMREAGLTVPAFFVLSVDWHRRVTEPLRPQIDALLRSADFTEPDSVRAAAARIRELYAAVPLPEDLEQGCSPPSTR